MSDQPFAPSFEPPAPPPPRALWLDVDVIGVLHRKVMVPEGWMPGEPLLEVAALTGWHVNTRPEIVDARPELEPFVVTPNNPRVLWQGGETVALRFADEAEFDAVMGPDARPPAPVTIGPIDL